MRPALIYAFVFAVLNPFGVYSQNIDRKTIDYIVDKMKDNVVRITTTFENGKDNHGFGTIVAERDNQLYIVTAEHVIYDADFNSKTRDVKINFFSNPAQDYSAVLLDLPDDPADVTLLAVEKPKGYSWSKKFYSDNVKKGTMVWFIGREGDWYVPVFPGFVNNATSEDISVEMTSIQPGTSGAPLINYDGIVGLIYGDENSSIAKAYPVGRISNLITKSWNHEWQLKLKKISHEVQWGIGGLTYQSDFNSELWTYMDDLKLNTSKYDFRHSGASCFTYRQYVLNKKFSIGATAVLEDHHANSHDISKTDFTSKGFYLMLDGRYYYIHGRRIQLFSGFSPGLAFITNKANDSSSSDSVTKFAFQLIYLVSASEVKLVFSVK